MDTKTPAIPLKHQEKNYVKKQEHVADVSLPPLIPFLHNRQRAKSIPAGNWKYEQPYVLPIQEIQKKRPYRVLQIGATPLMYACQQADRARVIKLLKTQEETIGYRDRTLRSALHYCMDASTGGAVATAAPELVNAPDAEGHSPLHLAVIAGDTQLVAVLLANGADVNAKDIEGHSVLHWATVCGEAECVRLLLAAGAKPSIPDLRGGSPLHYAAQCCGAAATAELAVPKKVGLKVLQTLLEFGADVNAKDEDGRQPILWAASAGSVEAVLALTRAGGSASASSSDKDGLTALHCAASRGHARCVESLVNLCGAQPDHVDDNGCSALHYASTLGHADATALLLKLGADPNRQDRKGRTPALCAAAKGQLETLKILAQHGGSLHARTVRGTGVGHEAVASGRIELVKWLVKRRLSLLDVATQEGKTPLHVAALHGYLDVCKVLLDNGARINAILRTSKGSFMTALDAALYRGHRDCAKLIQMHGGVTAQQIRVHNMASCKVFSTKLHLKHEESSTESDTTPIRIRKHRDPELYYEERWIERRTRRRGNVKKLFRHDSRSFSEEELHLLKQTTKKDHQRRSHSESAKYEGEISTDEILNKRDNRKRSKRRKCNSSSKQSESDGGSQVDENKKRMVRTIHRRSEDKKQKVDKNEIARFMKKKEDEKKSDSNSVSEDSLEVMVMKKSLEKKSEKVSGRSKTTRDEKSDKLAKSSRKSSRRKSSVGFTDEFTEELVASDRDKIEDSQQRKLSLKTEEKRRHSFMSESEEVENRYKNNITDSTSQDTVEQVTVTAIVHENQGPDTPKSIDDVTKDQVSDEFTKKEEEPAKSRMDDILEKADELHISLVTKAADLKKDMEEMRQQTSVIQKQSEENEEVQNVILRRKSSIKEKDIESVRGSFSKEGERRLSIVKSAEQEQSRRNSQDKGHQLKDEKDSLDFEEACSEETSKIQHENSVKMEDITEESELRENYSYEAEQTKLETMKPRSKYSAKIGSSNDIKKSPSPRKSPKTPRSKTNLGERKPKSQTERRASESFQTMETKAEEIVEGDFVKDQSFQIIDTKTYDTTVRRLSQERPIIRLSIDDTHNDNPETESSQEETQILTQPEDAISVEKVESKHNDNEQKEDQRTEDQTVALELQQRMGISGSENFRFIDDSLSSSPGSAKPGRHSRPSTGRNKRKPPSSKQTLFESSEENSPDRSAIIAVIESPDWEEEEEEEDELVKEISETIGEEEICHDIEQDDDDGIGVMRVLPPSTSEEETPRVTTANRPMTDTLPQGEKKLSVRIARPESSQEGQERVRLKQRRDSGGRDSGIEPSPRVSRIPRRNLKCCPNTRKQEELHMDTITRDVQISMRRYHLERKIFFQLMELKRLQIRHGRTNEHVLVKRQVDAFNKAGLTGPTLGVVKYDQPLTFRDFEAFLYEQLRRLQKRPATPDWCTEARQCTQRTHHCHHATSAYTSVPIYTYLGGGVPERGTSLLPKIESRGRGHMTVEVTHGEEKRVIALPAEKLNPNKRYFFTFTVKGDAEEIEIDKPSDRAKRNTKSG